MAKYIDFDALGVQSCNPDVFENKGYAIGWNSLMKILYDAPAADVEPKRKTGTWTEENVYFDQYAWRCSACREDWDLIEGTLFENNMRFCPNCGAKMDREEPHED